VKLTSREGAGVSESESPGNSTGGTEELNAVELGGMLRETRSSFQRELSDVALELRIRLVYLEAIESGRLDLLPGPAYASGFLRAYGEYLGLDGDDLVNRFRMAGGVGGGRMDLQLPSPVEEGRMPTGSILLVAAVLAVGAYGGWYYLSSQGRDPMKFVASLPDHFVALVGGESADPPEQKAATAAESDEKMSLMAAAPISDQPDAPPPAIEKISEAPETQRQAVAKAEEPLKEEARAETPVAEKVEAVASASAAPVLRAAQAPPQPQPQLIVVPPVAPAVPEPTPTIAATAETADVDAIHEPANNPVVAPSVRTEAVAPIEPEARPVPTISVVEPREAPSSTPVDDSDGAANALQEAVEAEVTTNAPVAQQAEVVEAPANPEEANLNKVIVRVTADSWVEVRSGDEDPMLSKVLHAGEVYEVPALPGLKLATGNAGGIQIVVNGRALPLLGPMGAVRRDVALDAESLLAGAVQAQ
jgi:cytoskeleton protein RodZ